MRNMKNIIDTWNMIEKFGLRYEVQDNGTIRIPDEDYARLMDSVKNKKYIKNITQ